MNRPRPSLASRVRRSRSIDQRRAESGESLVEILIALVIIGFTGMAILLAFTTAISASAEHRSYATLDVVLRSSLASATAQLESSSSNFSCPGSPAVSFSSPNYQPPSGFGVTVSSVEYWDSKLTPPAFAQSPCVANSTLLIKITATVGSLSSSVSTIVDDPFAPTVAVGGTPAMLAFVTQPTGATAGSAFSSEPAVAVEDSSGNIVTTDLSGITLSVTSGTGTSGATISNCSVQENFGVFSFAGCAINSSGSNYTLTATDTTLSGISNAVSQAFNVSAGAPAQLAFSTSPANATSNVAFSSQPAVEVEDAFGNVVKSDSSTVTLAVGTNPGGGTVHCTSNSLPAVNGVATFSGCSIDKSGAGYTLSASDGSLGAITSTAFSIAPGPAAQLVFSTSPSSATGGTAFSTQPVVTVEDAAGNTATGDSSTVTLAITSGTGTSGALLSGCSQTETAGVVAFTGCNINKSGTNYTLSATDASITAATSGAFNITTGPAYRIASTTTPGTSTSGIAFSTQPVLTIEDVSGNPITNNTSSVTLSVGSGPGSLSSCANNPVNAVAGVATFSGCKLTIAGTYTLTASDGSLVGATTSSFSVVAGSVTQLAFVTSPSNTTAATSFGSQPAVAIEDSYGNVVTTNTSAVTLSIGTNPGNGSLSCANKTVNAVAGVATFSGCSINKTGSGYKLSATDGAIASAASSGFNITPGAANQLVFSTSPAGATGGSAFSTQPRVTVEDAEGNTVTGDSSSVTLSITIGTGASGGSLSKCSQSESLGVVTFSNCAINTAGSNYQLTATDGALASATSGAFSVSVGTAAQLSFTTSPAASASGPAAATTGTAFGVQPVVTVEDAGGNTVTSNSSTVTLAIQSGSGTLSCSGSKNYVSATAGVATFHACEITLGTAGSFSLTATDDSLASATSGSFTVASSTVSTLAFIAQSATAANGVAFTTQPQVAVEDSSGDVITTSTASIALTISSGSNKGTLSCTTNTTLSAVNGVASFGGCEITLKKNSYTFTLQGVSGSFSGTTTVAVS